MGSVGGMPLRPLGMGALSELHKATVHQTASQTTPVARSPPELRRFRFSYPSVYKCDAVEETEAVKVQYTLVRIYHELESSDTMILYTGKWVTKPYPSTKYEYTKVDGKCTEVTEWTQIEYVLVPSVEDENVFALIVLTGLYNYFWTMHVIIMNLSTLIEAVESGEVSLEEGKTDFPKSPRRVFPPVKTVKRAKKRLRDWLETHGFPRYESSDLICYNTTIKLVKRVREQHKILRDELMEMWPKDVPCFGGMKVEVGQNTEKDAEGDVDMDNDGDLEFNADGDVDMDDDGDAEG